jgi:hypothetical protein
LFEEVGAKLISVRGASNISTILDSQLIVDFTDAGVLVIVDNDMEGRVSRVWEEALSAAASSGFDAAREVLLSGLDRKVHEHRFVQEFGLRAIEQDCAPRLSVLSLPVSDIVEALPLQAFLPDMEGGWADLWRRPDAPSGSSARKTWASKQFGLKLDDSSVRAACDSLAGVPPPLAAVPGVLHRLAQRRPGSGATAEV